MSSNYTFPNRRCAAAWPAPPTCVAGNPVTWTAEVMEANDYYPFGQVMPSRTYALTGAKKTRFGFNGKEKDNEVIGDGVTYDYGFRIYDARLARFLSVDPLTRNYPSWSPYPFAMNRPIDGVDLDGLEWKSEHYWKDPIKDPTQIQVLTDAGVFKEGMTYQEAWNAYAPILYGKYDKDNVVADCADLCYKGVVDFASQFKLPIYFKGNRSDNVDKVFDNDKMEYATPDDLYGAIKTTFGVVDLAGDYGEPHTIGKSFDALDKGDIVIWSDLSNRAHHAQTVVEIQMIPDPPEENSNLLGLFESLISSFLPNNDKKDRVIVVQGNLENGTPNPSKAARGEYDYEKMRQGITNRGSQEKTKARSWNFDSFDKHK